MQYRFQFITLPVENTPPHATVKVFLGRPTPLLIFFHVDESPNDQILTAHHLSSDQFFSVFSLGLCSKQKISPHMQMTIIWEKRMKIQNWQFKMSQEKRRQSSGLRINETKTEICIFHRSHSSILNVTLNNTRIQSTNTINILGTLFDSNMKWNQQYLKTIKEANTNLLLSNSRSLIAFQTNLVF